MFDNLTSRHNRFWSQPDDGYSASDDPNGHATLPHTGAARDQITKTGMPHDKICESICTISCERELVQPSINTLERCGCSMVYGTSVAKVGTSFERTEGLKRSGQRGLC